MLQLKIEKPKLPVIILSVFSEEDYAIKFFKAGASGYLTKTSAPELLVEAIQKSCDWVGGSSAPTWQNYLLLNWVRTFRRNLMKTFLPGNFRFLQ